MKKLFLLSILMTTFSFAQITDENGTIATGQNNIQLNGNIGIGITTTPTEKLEVLGTIKAEKGLFTNSQPDGAVYTNWADRNTKCLAIGVGKRFDATQSLFTIFDFPQSNLDALPLCTIGLEDRNYKTRWGFNAEAGGASALTYYNKNQSAIYKLSEDGSDNVYLKLPKDNSYLTIGTSSYSDNGDLYKLTVNGKIRSHAVKVYTDWADFVFETNYTLPTLDEVENYIKINGHLKDIPSAMEVEKNGIELGEMNKLLLQKIEELTLYTIQLKKEIDGLKTKMY